MPDQATAVVNVHDQSKKFKIKVQGVEKEVSLTDAQVIDRIQISEDQTQKYQALAEKERTLKEQEEQIKGLRVIIDEMEADPKLKETLNKVYSDFKSGKLSKPGEKTDSLKKLDRLIEETSEAGERERLRDIRDIIKEEGGVEELNLLKTEVKALRDELSIIRGAALTGVTERIERDITTLEERFGKDLVAKHVNEIRKTAIKYPQNPISKIFKYLCPDEEYDRAVLDSAKRKEHEELERKKKGSSPNDTTFTPKTEIKKDVYGRVSISSIAKRARERLGK